jgi:hypothetical protein
MSGKHHLWLLALVACATGFHLPAAFGADILVVGNWTRIVDQNDLASGAGSDIRTPIESAVGQVQISISNTGGGSWSLLVAKSDTNWPAGVSAAVKRTSDGSGSGTISGGTAYLVVTATNQIFISGTGDRSDIQLQLKTEGLSVRNSPSSYSTTLTYTLQ